MGHSPFRIQADLAWSFAASDEMRRGRLATSEPLIYQGRAYVLSWDLTLSALSLENGGFFWQKSLKLKEESESAFGGGMAMVNDTLFVATGAGQLYALNVINGDIIWTKALKGPARAGPLVHLGQLYVTLQSGTIEAFGFDGDALMDP